MPAFPAIEVPFWQQCLKMLAALTGLVGILLLGVHLLKRCRVGRLRSQPMIRILETHYLTPKASLHLVAVGSTRFLVGNAGERLTLLTALPNQAGRQEEVLAAPFTGSLVDQTP
ncbi:MAG: flagellar biosynthetic protein FliO [Deltaproteobacteria bacterium]|nr:flagellar biosynthetic protein FliO [Deltaproteobacteria bacterium]